MSEVNWCRAYSGNDRVLISLFKSALDKEGIVNVEFNQQDSSYLTFGSIHLMVPEEDAESAKALIEQIKLLQEDSLE